MALFFTTVITTAITKDTDHTIAVTDTTGEVTSRDIMAIDIVEGIMVTAEVGLTIVHSDTIEIGITLIQEDSTFVIIGEITHTGVNAIATGDIELLEYTAKRCLS